MFLKLIRPRVYRYIVFLLVYTNYAIAIPLPIAPYIRELIRYKFKLGYTND